ncbi:ANTAR domain-containing protein [Streptomyces sp. NPDC085942]|uniref:ANTAR domain-containing protein n=1 Tax=Streptomyces sp. NPDC085942 TaxID=3365743 RepID=UPI0037D563A0
MPTFHPAGRPHSAVDGRLSNFPSAAGVALPADDPSCELLREENAQLKQALESRPVIDMARGVLMATFRCTSQDAWWVLVTVSQHANTKLRVVAEALVAATGGEPMPEDLSRHLADAVNAAREK